MKFLNNLLLAVYASTGTILTALVDANVLGKTTAVDIAAIVTTFAVGFHGSQAVVAVKASPVGAFTPPTVTALSGPVPAEPVAAVPVTAQPVPVPPPVTSNPLAAPTTVTGATEAG